MDGPPDYPAHGILRRVAVVRGLRGEGGPAREALRRLAQLLSGEQADRVVLQTVRLAAHAETAATLATRQTKVVRRMLDSGDADCPGLLQLLAFLEAEAAGNLTGIWSAFQDWPATVKAALQGDQDAYVKLAGYARRIGY
jgi:hypothetical protein